MTSADQLSLYVRHWHPSTLTIDPPKEVVLKESLVEHLKEEVTILFIGLMIILLITLLLFYD